MSTTPSGKVRVRFAPSPTGFLHIGGARTALFNWLFARKHNGTFILRIEDTDQKRYVPEAEQDIKDSLRWLGMDWQEGPDINGPHAPYYQSRRTDLYKTWADWLVKNGHAYRCNCTPERLAEVRARQEANKEKPGYDRHCRDLDLDTDIGSHVVRFKMPAEGETTIHDLIRGDITFQNADLEDLVLLKSDGLPTYHLANVVDDHHMEISHIMRADEWIATAPLHRQLYLALGWEMPEIAHLPVILSPSGKGKLSKRDQAFEEGNTKVLVQVREYRNTGYLPEAIINFLMNVGWSYGEDREVFTVDEALPRFEIKDINPAGTRLPFEKLEWLNGVYIRNLSPKSLPDRLKPFLENAGLTVDVERLRMAAPLVQERIKVLSDVVDMLGFLFRPEVDVNRDQLIIKNYDAAGSANALREAHRVLSEVEGFDPEAQESAMRQLADRLNLKIGDFFGAVRVAVTGQKVSPPLFEIMVVIGRETSLKRIEDAVQQLEA
jgi:glutamyl-tRNA synthetase